MEWWNQPKPEATQSLYRCIKRAVQYDGMLPQDFVLPVPRTDSGYYGPDLYPAEGAAPDIAPLCQILDLVSNGQFGEAEQRLLSFFSDGRTMLPLLEEFQRWITDSRVQLQGGRLYRFSSGLLMKSSSPECIKFALSTLDLLNIDSHQQLKEVILTLALCEEFTLFCLYVIESWTDARQVIFDLSQRMRGWGKAHAVAQLQPNAPKIRDWLTLERQHQRLTALPPLREEDDLPRLLQEESLSSRDLAVASALMRNRLRSKAGQWVDEHTEETRLAVLYLNLVIFLPPTVETVATVCAIHDYLGRMGTAAREKLETVCIAFLQMEDTASLISAAVRRGECFALAKKIGLDCDREIYARIQSNFDREYRHAPLLMDCGQYVDELIQLFSRQLPLDTLAAGPDNELGAGPAFASYGKLSCIVRCLSRYPARGERLIYAALLSPVIHCRATALDTLGAWRRGTGAPFSSGMQNALDTLRAYEVNPTLRQRLELF